MSKNIKLDSYITYEEIKDLIEYDPNTGLLQWKIRKRGRCKKGWFTGTILISKDGKKYYRIQVEHKKYLVSRVAYLLMMKEWPRDEIDHKNGDSLDNSWNNLRAAIPSQNSKNKNVYRNNILGVKGVCKYRNKYKAQIMIGGAVQYLGLYNTVEEASYVYETAAKAYHDDFYYKNYMEP